MSRELILNGIRIADDTPMYVIAELGSNHQGSVYRARELIEVAALCGVQACKLQKKQIQTLYAPELLDRPYVGPHSLGATYGAHKRALELGAGDVAVLQQITQGAGVMLFATPFDEASAHLLNALKMPAFKIHSGGLTDEALIRTVAGFAKPILLSTGGSTESDIDQALQWAKGCSVAILHCTAEYPVAKDEHLNLRYLTRLRERYNCVIGWSAHDTAPTASGINNAILAYGLGARILEKHFTLDHTLPGTDHAFSLEPSGLRKLVQALRHAHAVMGDGEKRFYDEERAPIAKMRRSLTPDGWRITGECLCGVSTTTSPL